MAPPGVVVDAEVGADEQPRLLPGKDHLRPAQNDMDQLAGTLLPGTPQQKFMPPTAGPQLPAANDCQSDSECSSSRYF